MDTLERTDVHGKPIIERRHISFSALDKFATCARRFHHYEILKDIAEPTNPAMLEGFKAHKAIADHIQNNKPLPDAYAGYKKWVDAMLAVPHQQVLTEHRLAMTYDLEPCEYFSRKQKVWLRAQADLLTLNGNTALSVDWKTGAEKDPKYEMLPTGFQLRITAMLLFLHFPKLRNITSHYVYLNEGTKTTFEMEKADLRLFIPQVYEYEAGLHRAIRSNVWPPRTSGLCKKHCAVTTCEYWGKGNR